MALIVCVGISEETKYIGYELGCQFVRNASLTEKFIARIKKMLININIMPRKSRQSKSQKPTIIVDDDEEYVVE